MHFSLGEDCNTIFMMKKKKKCSTNMCNLWTFQKKVTYIRKTCEILKRDYAGDIPPTLELMCKLPGVGPKMAHLCMDIGWGKLTGIGKISMIFCCH